MIAQAAQSDQRSVSRGVSRIALKRCGMAPPSAEPAIAARKSTVKAALKRYGRSGGGTSRITTGAIERRNVVTTMPETNAARSRSSGATRLPSRR